MSFFFVHGIGGCSNRPGAASASRNRSQIPRGEAEADAEADAELQSGFVTRLRNGRHPKSTGCLTSLVALVLVCAVWKYVGGVLSAWAACWVGVGVGHRKWKRELPWLISPRRMVGIAVVAGVGVVLHWASLQLLGVDSLTTLALVAANVGLVLASLVLLARARKNACCRYRVEGYELRDTIERLTVRLHVLEGESRLLQEAENRAETLAEKMAESALYRSESELAWRSVALLKGQRREIDALILRYRSMVNDLQIEIDALSLEKELGRLLEDDYFNTFALREESEALDELYERMIDVRMVETELSNSGIGDGFGELHSR